MLQKKGMQTLLAVNFNVLRGVNDVKAAHPEHQNEQEENREHGKFTANGNPGAKRTHANRKAKEPVAKPAKTLPVRIRKQQ